ncbi:S-layer homology domain-containing protein [Sporosalibacterium faouarense]|uniref:S-layer homology domain-containing protein n=1 Tax=Sporosalibacterium faouarense TaxID=516123 RepID=UPI00192B6BCA|nr:S-layer homology domain-containing protein [Sporosalibacterium faouarense]
MGNIRKWFTRFLAVAMSFIVLLTAIGTHVVFSDDAFETKQMEAANHLLNLEFISGDENGNLELNKEITREEFAYIIVSITDLNERAEEMASNYLFPDVSRDRWSNGAINVVVDKGYLTGKLDGYFHPEGSLTYAEVITSLVRLYGYDDSEISGKWPESYDIKAKNIGITDGVELKNNSIITKGEVAVLVYNLLNATSKDDTDINFAESNNLFKDCIILENSNTSDMLSANEVLTDKGTFYLEDGMGSLEPGETFRLKIENDIITKAFEDLSNVKRISVEMALGNKVTYSLGNYNETMTLPSKTTYYYKGEMIDYSEIQDIIEVNSSIVLSMNENGVGYEYGVIYDPVYSEPEVAMNYSLADGKLGAIKIDKDTKITRNGEIISIEQIEDENIVYEVRDIWEKNKFILVVDNKVSGEIEYILPNKLSPKSITIDGESYELSKDIDLGKISNRGVFQTNDMVTLMLGKDGKIVDISMYSSEDNSYYALVLNQYTEESISIEDFGKKQKFVKLLHTNGATKTYKINLDNKSYNGKLVKYKVLDRNIDDDEDDYESVSLEILKDKKPESHTIDKYEKKIDSNYFADNVVIFNLVNNIYGGDSEAYIMGWDELPNGPIEKGKVKYLNKVGDFQDVNVMFVENILDENCYQGIVTKTTMAWDPQNGTTYTHTILVNGNKYTTNHHVNGMSNGDVVELEMKDNRITSIQGIKYPWVESSEVQAIDSSRIKIKNEIYKFDDNIGIYYVENGDYDMKGIDDIKSKNRHGRVKVYLDKSTKYGGKVKLLIYY